jgi:hypothetical protein
LNFQNRGGLIPPYQAMQLSTDRISKRQKRNPIVRETTKFKEKLI